MSVSVTPGGLTPPRSWSRAIHPPTELRLLRCTNEQSAPRAAGVNPPWVALTHLQWRFGNCRKTVVGALADAVAIAFVQPRGRLRPPLLFRICDCRLAIGRLVMHERSGNHGGLTPPALGHMRSRIAKVAFPCERLPNRQGNSSPSHLFRRRCFRASQKSLFHRRANDVHQERRA